jgi:hypothetical protein
MHLSREATDLETAFSGLLRQRHCLGGAVLSTIRLRPDPFMQLGKWIKEIAEPKTVNLSISTFFLTLFICLIL